MVDKSYKIGIEAIKFQKIDKKNGKIDENHERNDNNSKIWKKYLQSFNMLSDL